MRKGTKWVLILIAVVAVFGMFAASVPASWDGALHPELIVARGVNRAQCGTFNAAADATSKTVTCVGMLPGDKVVATFGGDNDTTYTVSKATASTNTITVRYIGTLPTTQTVNFWSWR